jgi:hypothetical protein
MQAIHIIAEWKEDIGRMDVSISFGDETYHELFNREAWREFMYEVMTNKPLRLGGMKIKFSGGKKKASVMDRTIREYMHRVNRALEAVGSTDYLPA